MMITPIVVALVTSLEISSTLTNIPLVTINEYKEILSKYQLAILWFNPFVVVTQKTLLFTQDRKCLIILESQKVSLFMTK